MKIETLELFEKIKSTSIDSDATVSSLFEKHIKFIQIVPWLQTEKYSAFFIVNDHIPELHFIENNDYLTLMKFVNLNFPDFYMNYSIVKELLYKENKIKVLTYNNRFINLDIDILLTEKSPFNFIGFFVKLKITSIKNMINNFLILKKLDYLSEKNEKRKEIDFAVETINTNMQRLNYVEAQKDDDTIKYVFSIGGDGTMLYAMHSTIEKESTIIGINSGKLGFLPPFLPNDLNNQNFFDFIKTDNNHKIEKRSILQHNLSGITSGFAVNEYAISAENPHNIIDISLEIETNGVISGAGHYKSNALIISSACGSTAFNLNAGGAIVDPSIKCMQIMMMAPATLASRPLIIGENSIIHVKMNNKCRIYSDNNLINDIEETYTKTLSISLMKKQSKLLLPNNWNFYDVLSKKLHWNNGGECQL